MKKEKKKDTGNKKMIIIDTDVLIEIFDKQSKKGENAIKKLENSGEDIAITSINLHEILYGHYKRNKKIKDILQIDTIEFNKNDAELSSKIEYQLEKQGKTCPRIDTMIAAITINRNAKIFTFNKKHYQNIKNIKLF
jgi:predicted nucleic acid-binding protein